ncbi:hypothetical protein CHS0354_014312 [Potamilus streckersoni]|uniref:Glutaredoxin-like protein n=1 Tax=Potamilus streckersoni TaxID=2493646 RepID=A0AAE0VX26_9BIVA|nr:hypothetical protein CHS0354_014312 [Potamilus streckersoni]
MISLNQFRVLLAPLSFRLKTPAGLCSNDHCVRRLQLLMQMSTNSADKPLPKLFMFTKPQCGLCEEAKEVLKPYQHRFHFEEVNILLPENKEWFEKYRYEIPVFHFEGEFLMKYCVNTKVLETALKEYETFPL